MHIAGNDADDDHDDNDLDLAAGYETEANPPPKTEAKAAPEEKTEDAKPESTNADTRKPEAKPQATKSVKETPAPKYRQITEEEFTALRSAADKTVSIEKQLSTALGTIGNVKQLVTKLQTQTPSGTQIALPKGVLKKLNAEFPEIAEMLEEDLNEAFKGIKGTGGDSAATTQLSDEEFDKRIEARRLKDAIEALEDEFPTWRKIVGDVDKDGKPDPNNAYRKWLAKQTAEYQNLINSTRNPLVIGRSIRIFRKAQKTAKASKTPETSKQTSPKSEARSTRIASAVTPKGAGGSPPSRNTADDDFEAGYASERGG